MQKCEKKSEAKTCIDTCLKDTEQMFGKNHLVYGRLCREAGKICESLDLLEEADALYRICASVVREYFGKESSLRVGPLYDLVRLCN